jgi:hypothetical protein
MDASSRELAAALAGRLNEIVQESFTVRAEGVRVTVSYDGQDLSGSPALEILDDLDGRDVEEKTETAVRAVLSDVQDRVMEASKGPWPGERGADLPMPDCRVTGAQLRVWFGDEDAPAVSVAPIALR